MESTAAALMESREVELLEAIVPWQAASSSLVIKEVISIQSHKRRAADTAYYPIAHRPGDE